MPPAPVRFPIQRLLPQVLWQSRLSANDKGHYEMAPGAVRRSPEIYLTTEENPVKPQETIDEGCATSHLLKLVPLPSNEVGGNNVILLLVEAWAATPI